MMIRRLIKNFSYMSLAFVMANIFGYFFHGVVSRRLGPSLYGQYSVLYSFLLAMSMPLGVLSVTVTRTVINAQPEMTHEELSYYLSRFQIILSISILVIFLISSGTIAKFLKVSHGYLLVPVALALSVLSVVFVLRGVLASVEAFNIISYSSIIELLVRAISGIALVILDLKVFGAICGSLIGAVTALFYLLMKRPLSIKKTVFMERQKNKNFVFEKSILKVFFIGLPAGLIMYLDTILSKRFFPDEIVGIYGAVSLIGKSILILSSIFATVLFPKLVKEKVNTEALRAFVYGLVFTVLIFLLAFICFKFIDNLTVLIVFGKEFLPASPLLSLYIIALLPLAIHLQIINYKIAIGGWTEGIWLWIVSGVYYIVLSYFSSSITSYILSIMIYHIVSSVGSFILLYKKNIAISEENLTFVRF